MPGSPESFRARWAHLKIKELQKCDCFFVFSFIAIIILGSIQKVIAIEKMN
jgi:hypothetical protein